MIEKTYCIECDKLISQREITSEDMLRIMDRRSAFEEHFELTTLSVDHKVLLRSSVCPECEDYVAKCQREMEIDDMLLAHEKELEEYRKELEEYCVNGLWQ